MERRFQDEYLTAATIALSSATMIPPDPVLHHELPVIRKIIDDETWLEGERRGCSVLPTDQIVRERVCEVVLRIGQELRETLSASLTTASPPLGVAPVSVTGVKSAGGGP